MTETTTDTSAKILGRVRALLAKAAPENGATPEEQETYGQKAAELMARHSLNEAMLDAAGRPGDDPVEYRDLHVQAPYTVQRMSLLGLVGRQLNVRVLSNAHPDGGKRAHLFGRRSDLDRLDFLYTSLLVQALRLVADKREYRGASAARTQSYRKNWMTGFAHRVAQRMEEATAAAVSETTGAELVLADRYSVAQQAALDYFTARGQRVGKAKRRAVTNASGYLDGHEAGGNADLDQRRLAGRRAIGA